jgi:hypothetical protein
MATFVRENDKRFSFCNLGPGKPSEPYKGGAHPYGSETLSVLYVPAGSKIRVMVYTSPCHHSRRFINQLYVIVGRYHFTFRYGKKE